MLVGHLVATQGPEIARRVAEDRAQPDFDTEAYVDELILKHRWFARLQGAGGGAMIAVAELPAVIGGPGAVVAAAGTAILGDLIALAWIEQRLVMHIAAAYGHNLEDPARINEFLRLAGVDLLFDGVGSAAGPPAAGSASVPPPSGRRGRPSRPPGRWRSSSVPGWPGVSSCAASRCSTFRSVWCSRTSPPGVSEGAHASSTGLVRGLSEPRV